MTGKKRDANSGLLAELEEIEAFYQIPEGAFTFADLHEKFPNIPDSRLHKTTARSVKLGEMKKARRGQDTFYWPAK
jgi:hypothetical protein